MQQAQAAKCCTRCLDQYHKPYSQPETHMTKSLKVIENLIELVYAELKTASQERDLNEKSYALLKEAYIASINLKRKVEEARGWIVTESRRPG